MWLSAELKLASVVLGTCPREQRVESIKRRGCAGVPAGCSTFVSASSSRDKVICTKLISFSTCHLSAQQLLDSARFFLHKRRI